MNIGLAPCVTLPPLGANVKLHGKVRKVSAVGGKIHRENIERINAKTKKVNQYDKGELDER